MARISISGELAYEVNVSAWDAVAVWEALVAAGEPYGITPYGTETMHVLRAEKGFIVVGQDTDGTVTPDDAGLGWALSKAKHYVGERSYTRRNAKQLVGLLPADPQRVLDEGAQLGAGGVGRGHVTSSYRSAALGRTFALALVRSGRERIGQTLYVPIEDDLVPVTVTDSVLFDKDGSRRDG